MVPFRAGSSVEGSFSSPYSGICIDFTYMDKINAFCPGDMDVVVQPGVNWVDLNNKIQHTGLFASLDPSPIAQLGGIPDDLFWHKWHEVWHDEGLGRLSYSCAG